MGIAGDKSTAKFASKLKKTSGVTVIPPWRAEQTLAPYPVTALCGVGRGIGEFLEKYHVLTCGDMKRIPVSVLSKRFGNIGAQAMADGTSQRPIAFGFEYSAD